jgi:CDP-glucose 4,6-dehydratase
VADVGRAVSTGSTFVTGASGLLGGWLVDALLQRGERVVVLQREATPREGCEVVSGDVTDGDLLTRTVAEQEVQTVFHLAAQTIPGAAHAAPAATFATNIAGTVAVLEAARLGGVGRTVVASTDKVYGGRARPPYTEDLALDATGPYEISKASADAIARSYWPTYGLPVAVVRLSNVYGGGDRHGSRLIPELVAAALDGRAPQIRSDGSPERDFVYVEDAAAACLAIAGALGGRGGPAACGEAFNAGSGRPVSVHEVVDAVGRVAGAPLAPSYEPAGAVPEQHARQYVDIAKIARVCGWTPEVGLEEGLRRTLQWYAARRGG